MYKNVSKQRLNEYVTQSRQAGLSDDQIKQALLSAGGDSSGVNEALDINLGVKKPIALVKTLAIIIVLGAFAGIGYFYFLNAQNTSGLVTVVLTTNSPRMVELVKRAPFSVFYPTKLPSKDYILGQIQQRVMNGKTWGIDWSIIMGPQDILKSTVSENLTPEQISEITSQIRELQFNVVPDDDREDIGWTPATAFNESLETVTVNGRKLDIMLQGDRVLRLRFIEDGVRVYISNGNPGYAGTAKLSKDEMVAIASSMKKQSFAADYVPKISTKPVKLATISPGPLDKFFVAEDISNYIWMRGGPTEDIHPYPLTGYKTYFNTYLGHEISKTVPPPEEKVIGSYRQLNVEIGIREQNLGREDSLVAYEKFRGNGGIDLIGTPIVTQFGQKIKFQTMPNYVTSEGFKAGWPSATGFVRIATFNVPYEEGEKETIRRYLLKYPSLLK